MNGVGREARAGCVVPNMQGEDDVKMIREIMDNPKCMWLQVDVGGGGWAPCDTPVVVDDGYVAAGALGDVGVAAGVAGRDLEGSSVALPLREVAAELGTLWSDEDGDSGSDVDMESSPLVTRARGRLGAPGVSRAPGGVCWAVG